MNAIEFNNDSFILPGSPLNPSRYKLPSRPIRFPLELPTSEDLPSNYNLPNNGDLEVVELPGLSIEEEMILGAIPRPFVDTVRFIHSGITPSFNNGNILLDGNATDIHHIVKRAFVKADKQKAREMLPFNGVIKGTFDLLTDTDLGSYSYKIGGNGHMLINLIPLDYYFHHSYVELREYAHAMNVKVGGNIFQFTIPELLMGLNIFNLRLRINALTSRIQNGLEECIRIIEATEDPKIRDTRQYHLQAWRRMEMEALRIPMAAEEIENDHPALFEVWRKAIGEAEPVFLLKELEQ